VTRYMLDTNIVSHLMREHRVVTQQVIAKPLDALCISAITEGELLAGLARRPQAAQLRRSFDEFCQRVDVLPWNREAAARYGTIRAALELDGRGFGALDLLIAAHAVSAGAVLVTNDQILGRMPGLTVEDWTVATQ
jgi:tRNA(fMet)-specific endonuclease VapC